MQPRYFFGSAGGLGASGGAACILPPMPKRVRADLALVDQGLAPSREKARALILAGEVLAGDRPDREGGRSGRRRRRAAAALGADAVRVARRASSWRTRSTAFGVDVRGAVALDVGASTGGFTDCLLQRGAARVYCVDVGQGQLDWKIASDPRVRVLDRVNIRLAPPDLLPEPVGRRRHRRVVHLAAAGAAGAAAAREAGRAASSRWSSRSSRSGAPTSARAGSCATRWRARGRSAEVRAAAAALGYDVRRRHRLADHRRQGQRRVPARARGRR